MLLVEDKTDFVEIFRDYCDKHGVELSWVSNKADAIALIDGGAEDIDVVVCDLKVPSVAGGLDEEVTHGLAVLGALTTTLPGVPVMVVSAFGTVEVLTDMVIAGRQLDIYGSHEQLPMLRFSKKSDVAKAIGVIDLVRGHLEVLAGIELVDVNTLDVRYKQALRVFARRKEGTLVKYRPLSGGLSGAQTGLATVQDGSGSQVAHAVAKLTRHDRALEEQDRYRSYVAGRLGTGTYADLTDDVMAGCGQSAGLFYSVADSFRRDLFEIVSTNDDEAASVVRQLSVNTSKWVTGVPHSARTWQEIRRSLIRDEDVADVGRMHSIANFPDEKVIQVRWVPQHADLHGANVLVDGLARPVLIDYGRTGPATSVLDPITLELSVVFHPESPFRMLDWPSEDCILNWQDVDQFIVGCPAPQYIRACRKWTRDVAVAKRDVLATISAYCLRNLQYGDVNHVRALAFQRAAVLWLKESYDNSSG